MPRPFWSGSCSNLACFVRYQTVSCHGGEERDSLSPSSAARAGNESSTRRSPATRSPSTSRTSVKGYEYRKGEYVTVEPAEIEHLRIPSRQTLEVAQFVDEDEPGPEFFEKPYLSCRKMTFRRRLLRSFARRCRDEEGRVGQDRFWRARTPGRPRRAEG